MILLKRCRMGGSMGDGALRVAGLFTLLSTFSTAAALDARQRSAFGGSGRATTRPEAASSAAARLADLSGPVDGRTPPAQVCELTAGIAGDIRDLVALAEQFSAGEATPLAQQLKVVAARLAARLHQQFSSRAVPVALGGFDSTVSKNGTSLKTSNVTRVPVLMSMEGRLVWGKPKADGSKDMGIREPDGGSSKSTSWDTEEPEKLSAWIFAFIFVGIVASAPIVPHMRKGAPPPTRVHYAECLVLLLWLFSGLYVFHYEIKFQSPHFSKPRALRLEESVYLISQIITTVGYGDITPAHTPGQIFIAFFALFSIMLASKVVGDLVQMFQDSMEEVLLADVDEASAKTDEEKLWAAIVPMIQSGIVFFFFLFIGAAFFHLYPNENKTLGQGIYMSIITLSTVGFGAFTPETRGGMVFGAYWMLFGVGALGAVVSARVAFTSALIRHEREKALETTEAGPADQEHPAAAAPAAAAAPHHRPGRDGSGMVVMGSKTFVRDGSRRPIVGHSQSHQSLDSGGFERATSLDSGALPRAGPEP